eukprot:CAMPEP_0178386452 /NCGR_PEP_ID=MMETSP0689_2-20121128/8567_1 /TAXON_ID=160604 /ORGANISM="Amphidinium massartii, Strain CS-259" /LENGTH=418 /DNA_ID=CAMNT_0020006789 /DNA_START=76 /DNA_END=1328 /DNA_ORIENTATION=-
MACPDQCDVPEQLVGEHKSTFFATCLNLFTVIEGIGLLGLPHAVYLGGWCALVATPVLAGISAYSGCLVVRVVEAGAAKRIAEVLLLQQDQNDLGRRPSPTSSDTVEFADMADSLPMSRSRRALVRTGLRVFQNVELFIAVAIKIVLGGNLLQQLIGDNNKRFLWLWTMVFAVPCLPTTLLPSMAAVAKLSACSIVAMGIVLVVVLVYVQATAQRSPFQVLGETAFLGDGVATSLGILVFAFAAHAQFPAIARSMEEPQRFTAALASAMLAAAVVNSILGLGVYGVLGADTPEVLTAALPAGSVLRVAATLLLVGNQASGFPLPVFALSGGCLGVDACPRLVRFSIAALAAVLAVAVPRFVGLMSLTGSLTGAVLCFVAPCGCELFRQLSTPTRKRLVKVIVNLLLVLLGLAFGCWGT